MVNAVLTTERVTGVRPVEFTEAQLHRYARHIVLPEVGGIGQAKLLNSKVLIIGMGGLGSPLALYLAAAGIGTIGMVDNDRVDLSNLHRQVLYDESDSGGLKTGAAEQRVKNLDPSVKVVRHELRLDDGNAAKIIANYDIVADGSDNYATRAAVHAACRTNQQPLVSAAVQALDGQLTTYKSYLGDPHPCMRCLYKEAPSEDALPTCSQGGVLGPAAGVVGTLQAVEVIKELLGIGQSLSGTMVLYDALSAELTHLRLPRRAGCPLCGQLTAS